MKKTITPESMSKLVHRIEKSAMVDDEMKDICTFVKCRYMTINKDGVIEMHRENGLRLQNTIYYLNGSMQLLNKEPQRLIEETMEGIPDWADERLTSIYNAFYNK